MTATRVFNTIRRVPPAAWLAPLLLLAAYPALAQGAEDLRLPRGKSIVIDYPEDIRQISTSDPDIIDASPVTTREILVHAKSTGTATMVVWTSTNQRMFYNVNVILDVEPLRRILGETFPGESITVNTSGSSISLNGMVSNAGVAERAASLATPFAPTVVNNLQLPAPGIERQVLLRVKFAVLDRQKARELGVNFLTNGAFNVTGGFVRGSATQFNIGGIFPNLDNFQVQLAALQSRNVLQILAEPNLVAENGKEATFLVGGEFPIPVIQGGQNAGAVTIQYKEFGIRLRFTPQVTGNQTVKMALQQEVSSLDLANGINFGGFTIPAIATRRAETSVELGDGQSFVVAGLLNNEEREAFSQIPVIGSVPILGNLFKSQRETKNRSELVMLVTPEITMPLNPSDVQPELVYPNPFLPPLTPEEIKRGAAAAKPGVTTASN